MNTNDAELIWETYENTTEGQTNYICPSCKTSKDTYINPITSAIHCRACKKRFSPNYIEGWNDGYHASKQ